MLCKAGFPGKMGPGGTLVTPFPTYSPYTRSYLVYAQGQGITLPSVANLDALDTLIRSMNTAGIWDKLDYFNMYAHDSADQNFGLINIVNPYDPLAKLVSSPTYTRKSGFLPDGVASYIETPFIPLSYPKYLLNDASRVYFIFSAETVGTMLAGNQTNANDRMTLGGSVNCRINQGNTGLNTAVTLGPTGLVAINRIDATNVNIYNGVTLNARTAASTSLSGFKHCLGASNGGFSNAGHSLFMAGASLDAQNTDLNTAINTYLTTVAALP